ncbi:uncharacterized protein LOC129781350 [Toxorhynchites rutilus septentrionalis]|uniref:uncharacterized protein LOC129781350 n=1 Tax=Toxorhynchites rutilus septentrionalis TaxID=329112 RepID=UPI002479AA64|nr:uncharacterized protein LOC129781350 [Toxorhynchites rutilus septentrionalis]
MASSSAVSKTIQAVTDRDFKDARPQRDENNKLQYVIHIRNKEYVDALLGIKSLIDKTPVEITYHPTLYQRKCVVSCRDVIDMAEAVLLKELTDQRVIAIKRISRMDPTKKELIPIPNLILTIRGIVIPEYINFGFIRAPTRNFYPNPMQCFGCYKFGHTSKKCRTKIQLCRNCGRAHPELGNEETAKNFICNAPAFCVNCSGNHPSTNRKCPAWVAENNITKVRVDQGISYKEAKQSY